ncbi:MAG TPA: T9SS type A sorting domain-containing protein, partial [Chitinophagaceae bacterium]|nr:T9SS type A sorting domain-containing protein [Chitinophagaceae bacterium]
WRTYPVPFNSILVIDIPQGTRASAQIKLTDVKGRILYNRHYNITANQSNIVLTDLYGLPAGTYMLTIDNESTSNSFKVIKQ